MKKRILSLFVVLSLFLNVLPLNTYAVTDSGVCGNAVVWQYSNGRLIISGDGPMGNLYNSPWDAYRNEITTVLIQDGVTTIADYAFENCELITYVSIPNSVTSIGYKAFYYCTSLVSVNIPTSVTSIGEYAFQYCDSLTTITIPGNIRAVGSYTFADCLSLKTVRILEGVNRIERNAFQDCASLENIYLPQSLRSIYSFAFDGCSSLFLITIPQNVDRIEIFAFSSLSSVIFQGDAPAQFEDFSLGNTLLSPIVALYPSYRNWPQAFLSEHSSIYWTPYDTPIEIDPPTTVPPVTEPPATEPPVTEPPVTEPPVTEPPATQPPTTEPPASDLDPALPSVVGAYTTDLIFPASDLGVPSYIADSVIRATVTFTNDGKVSMTWRPVSLTALRVYFYELFVNAYYAMAYGAGITTPSDIEEFCLLSTGMSVGNYVNSIVTHEAMVAAFTPAPTSGTYSYNADHTAILTDLAIMDVSSDPTIENSFVLGGGTLYLTAASWGKPDYTFVCTAQ